MITYKKQILDLIIVMLILVGLSYLVKAQNGYPEPQDLFVNDYANVISAEDSTQITNLFSKLKADTGIEATVLTINSINDYPTNDESIESFATNLFNTWGIGSAETHDGVLVLVAVKDREMRIEVGTGYESTRNAALKRVIDESMIPQFRKNNYSEGIYQGVRGVVTKLTDKIPPDLRATPTKRATRVVATRSSQPTYSSSRSSATSINPWVLGGGVAGTAGAVGFGIRQYLRHRKRRCPHCNTEMIRLDEVSDDIYLDSGQKLEELLKSIDYDVWKCNTCNYHTIEAYRTWFSSYKDCPQCNHRTVKVESVTLSAATYDYTGIKQITRDCRHCDYRHQSKVTIPKRTRSDNDSWSSGSSSSSSSSSGGSFGGGSSSGGGASGSW